MSDFIPIDIISNPSLEEFNDNYGFKLKPVLITDITTAWQASTAWTNIFFKTQMGDFQENATRVNDKKDNKTFKVFDYFNYMENCEDTYPYYLTNCKFHLKTDMRNDYVVPEYFKSCLQILGEKLPIQFQLSWLYIGAQNTYSGLHLDLFDTSAWNAVITGRKFWLFYPPDQASYLYHGQVNPFNPDLDNYPEFSKAKPIVCYQNPGEVVYTPSGWWHAVYNKESGVSLTENFINNTNHEMVKIKLRKYERMEEIKVIDECMSQIYKINNSGD